MTDPARPPAGAHALPATDSLAAVARFWLTIGVLDARTVSKLREVLSGLAARTGIGLTIDLTALDDQHHLTAGALLSAAAHAMHGHDSTLTAHNPPGGLAPALTAIPIPVTYGQQPADAVGDTRIQVGAAHPPAPGRHTRTADHTSRNETAGPGGPAA
jgi:hypothetical protein